MPHAIPGPGHSPGAGGDAVSPAPSEPVHPGIGESEVVECLTSYEKMDRYCRTTVTGKNIPGIIEGKG
ncbi:hypothetical protein, partial [Methanoregula sp.]|uniref:hypothetical protein n=1 Tax=Methanoregula sp. TaxID=2052170 RepID=UPI003C749889